MEKVVTGEADERSCGQMMKSLMSCKGVGLWHSQWAFVIWGKIMLLMRWRFPTCKCDWARREIHVSNPSLIHEEPEARDQVNQQNTWQSKNQDLDPGLFGSRNHGYLRRQFSLGSLKPTKCCSFLKEHMGKSPCPYGSNRDRSENQGRKQRAQDEIEGQ